MTFIFTFTFCENAKLKKYASLNYNLRLHFLFQMKIISQYISLFCFQIRLKDVFILNMLFKATQYNTI